MNHKFNKFNIINNKTIIEPIKPKFNKKANIYFLSKKRVEEKKFTQKLSNRISLIVTCLIVVVGFYYTN